jgi:hypothetical protein
VVVVSVGSLESVLFVSHAPVRLPLLLALLLLLRLPYVERLMHHFGCNILIPQRVIVEGNVETGHPTK